MYYCYCKTTYFYCPFLALLLLLLLLTTAKALPELLLLLLLLISDLPELLLLIEKFSIDQLCSTDTFLKIKTFWNFKKKPLFVILFSAAISYPLWNATT